MTTYQQFKRSGWNEEFYIQKLKSDDPKRRFEAANSLGDLDESTNASIHALADALRDPESGVRNAAAYSLGDRGPSSLDAVPALVVASRDPVEHVRTAAVLALAMIVRSGEVSVAPALREAAKGQDGYARRMATEALREVGLEE